MDYQTAVAYLESLVDYERKVPGAEARQWNLERISQLLADVGNPHHRLRAIHVAGTKGKGSTSALLAAILQAAGYRVGLFTSPHLTSFRERIRINGERIPPEQVAELVVWLQPHLQAVTGPGGPPSFFEAYTALAFAYFARARVDLAVIETGLGGRLDATNVVTPLVSVITRIAYDHMQELGDSLAEIAAEKAGIIKPGVPVISAPQLDPVWAVLREASAHQHASLHGVRLLAEPPSSAARLAEALAQLALGRPRSLVVVQREATLSGLLCDIKGLRGEYRGLRCPLLGEHQFSNLGLAVGTAELLEAEGISVSPQAIHEGLAQVAWPGRLQIASRNPWVVLDGAHDAVSAVALRQAVGLFAPERLILVLAISRDKDIEAIGAELCPLAETVIFTTTGSPRAASPEELQRRLAPSCRDPRTAPAAAQALELATGLAGRGDLVLVTGSLYLVGEALRALGLAEPD